MVLPKNAQNNLHFIESLASGASVIVFVVTMPII